MGNAPAEAPDRDIAMRIAYQSGNFTLKEVGADFGLHCATIIWLGRKWPTHLCFCWRPLRRCTGPPPQVANCSSEHRMLYLPGARQKRARHANNPMENDMNVYKIAFVAVFTLLAATNANATTKTNSSDYDLFKDKPAAAPFWEKSTQIAQSLPDCPTMDGGYCSTPGIRARCYWYQYQEPMTCVCQPDNVWVCM